MAAPRRGLAGLQPLLAGLGRLALSAELGSSVRQCLVQTAAPLLSLRSFEAAPAATCTAAAALARSFNTRAGPLSQGGAAQEAGESLEQIQARIFGTHIGDGQRSGRKLLRGKLLGPAVVDWYPQDILKADPFMLDLKAEKAKIKLDRLRRRGKAPPKKGAGKRSGKK